MANLVEFLVKIKDMASGPLAKIAGTGNKSFTQLESNVNSFSAKFGKLGMSISDIDKKLDSLRRSRSISLDTRQIRQATSEIEQLERRKARLEGSGSRGGSNLMALAGSSLALGGIAGGVGALGAIAGAGMNREATKMRFEVMAGKEAGGQLAGNLTKFAEKSIYGNEVFDGAQTMMAFGINAQKVMPQLKMLGDVAMGDTNRLKMLTLAFSQVSAAGKLTGSDLLQFVNAGFNPLQEISAKTGKSLALLKEEVSDGKISFTDVAGAFQSATSAGGRFYEMTEKLNTTGFGKWQAFKGSVEGLAASFGEKLLPYLTQVIDKGQIFVNLTSDGITWLSDYGTEIKTLTGGLLAGAAAYQAITLGTKLWTVGTTFHSIATGKLTIAQWALNTAMLANPVTWVAAGIAALAAGVIYCWNKFEGFRGFIFGFGESFKQVFTNIGTFFKNIFSPVIEALNAFQNPNLSSWEKTKVIGASLAKMALNLSPVGMMANAAAFTSSGGLTQGVSDKYRAGYSAGVHNFREAKGLLTSFNGSTGQTLDQQGNPLFNAGNFFSGMLQPKSKGASEIVSSLGTPNTPGATPKAVEEAAQGITSGGVRTQIVNVNKFFEDLHFHSGSTNEGITDIEAKITEMFIRVTGHGGVV